MHLTEPFPDAVLAPMLDLLRGRRVVVLSGAGCSTESGIPDYRGADGTERKRAPMQYGEFVRSADARARYWARSAVGWPRFTDARPNDGHRALARLEEAGLVRGVITQNIDGLHHAAGSRRVVELHGSLAAVRCLTCGEAEERGAFQERLLALNDRWSERLRREGGSGGIESAPDGDAELPAWAVASFRVPGCGGCGSVMKPDVVFFGESVPKERVDAAWRLFEEADVLLVAGSSLAVYSGRRFTDRARREGVPIAVINSGPTRADEAAAVKVDGRLGRVLPVLVDALVASAAGGSSV
ncbi:MAG: NAD-dependent protein deacetylase [Gemmatimonadetes bacterium]|nr:NAD-dependent protein deacetylase [Gemmatimonadota bacterium]